ncbi:Dps family protein [Roseomonas chloroacetimidivorans]|jgi:starvation-inducible DNA-binding protein|uniref:Dps family protein n=1 Tax=Roseomonas chloroacetimidivorans TaxID=1766656 RepID=UPI003C769C08
MTDTPLQTRRLAALLTPSGLSAEAIRDIPAGLSALLADVFALYLKTKNFHWHAFGPHFRDYHLMFDEQAGELLAMVDPAAERARKLGGTAIRSVGHVARLQRVLDNDAEFVGPQDMLAELREDNGALVGRMRALRSMCDEHGDVATASLLENWIDEAEGRVWFLFETGRRGTG